MDDVLKNCIKKEVSSCDGVVGAEWDTTNSLELKLEVAVHLPQDCIAAGKTPMGVRSKEPIRMVFDERYPFSAPKITLRDDFPRCFPHIYPSSVEVRPCVYEGSISDLIQQAGIRAVVFQLTEWLRKAASDDLMDFSQGWEWMRNDEWNGELRGDFPGLREHLLTAVGTVRCWAYLLLDGSRRNFTAVLSLKTDKVRLNGCAAIPCFIVSGSKTSSRYFARRVGNVKELSEFFEENVGPGVIRDVLMKVKQEKDVGRFIVLAMVRRPVNLINLNSNIEPLPFLVKVKRIGKGVVSPESTVELLCAVDICSPLLMRRVSGHNHAFNGKLIQLGCGSVGSKLALHLMRNGAERFVFVDNDLFRSHNMARHALTFDLMSGMKIQHMAEAASRFAVHNEIEVDYIKAVEAAGSSDLIIDSTASLTVRNRLSRDDIKARIVHTALYGKRFHQCGVCFLEGVDRNPRLDDLCFTFMRANIIDEIAAIDYTAKNLERNNYGQGCSSLTMNVDDSTISLLAAGMAHRIQHCIDEGACEFGECAYGITDDGESIIWKTITMGKTIVIPGEREDGFSVRILSAARQEMERMAVEANGDETGGFIIGAITPNTMTITVVACLPPPVDSLHSSCSFVVGCEGVLEKEKRIVSMSNGILSVIGTWHSHPFGGEASCIDRDTYDKIFSSRNAPTLCLIWKPDGLECLPEVR